MKAEDFLVCKKQEFSNVINKITIKASDLKVRFREIGNIMTQSSYSKIVEFTINKDFLILRVGAGAYYESFITTEDNNTTEEIKVCVVYKNITDILPTKGELSLTIAPTFVAIKGDMLNINLTLSREVVAGFPKLIYNEMFLNLRDLKESLDKCLELKYLAGLFKTTGTVLYNDDKCIVKYASLYMQTKSSGIKKILPIKSIVMLKEFLDTAVAVHMYDCGEYIAVVKEQSTLYLIASQLKDFKDLVTEYKDNSSFIGGMDFSGIKGKLYSLQKIAGKCDCKIYVYSGKAVKINVESMEIAADIDTMKEDTNYNLLGSFVIKLALLNNLLNILGSEFDYYSKDHFVILESISTLIVTTSR